MSKNVSLEELIIELQPYSEELVLWCQRHPEFADALKSVHPEKFVSPAIIITSYPKTGDEVIGVITYHHGLKNPTFKQDFIVNVGMKNEEYILFTRNPAGSSKYVKDINEFFDLYGNYGYTRDAHHLKLEDLPIEITERAQMAIDLAKRREGHELEVPPQELINKIYSEVMEIKKKKHLVKLRLSHK